jgi:hypothetical protein
MGIESQRAAILSLSYPLVQIFVLLVANQFGERLNRRSTIIYGYAICLAVFFALLLTQVSLIGPSKKVNSRYLKRWTKAFMLKLRLVRFGLSRWLWQLHCLAMRRSV